MYGQNHYNAVWYNTKIKTKGKNKIKRKKENNKKTKKNGAIMKTKKQKCEEKNARERKQNSQ